MKNIIRIVFVAVCLTASVFASSLTPQNATEAVFYAHGVVAAQAEALEVALPGAALGDVPVVRVVSFRTMASNSEMLILLFKDFPDSRLLVFYFAGRASAFHALADMAGEP